jgi:glycerol-3-phosphate O-acyltransferase
VTAGSLVATALLDMEGRGLAHKDLVTRSSRLMRTALRSGARTARTLAVAHDGEPMLRESSIREATLLFIKSDLVRQHVPDDTLTRSPARRERAYAGRDVVYTVPEEARSRLDLAKNAIIHFFVDRAMVSIAMLSLRTSRAKVEDVMARALRLSKLFDQEFAFRTARSPEEVLTATVDDMVAIGELARSEGDITFGRGAFDLDGASSCRAHARHLENFLEAYLVAARTLRVLVHGPLGEKEFLVRALSVGQQMFLGGEIDRREAVSRPTIETALHAFIAEGHVKKSLDKLELVEHAQNEATVRLIEEEITSFRAKDAGTHA